MSRSIGVLYFILLLPCCHLPTVGLFVSVYILCNITLLLFSFHVIPGFLCVFHQHSGCEIGGASIPSRTDTSSLKWLYDDGMASVHL